MKQSYLALFFLIIIGLCSCRKDGNDIDIKTYDQNQIDAYIKANNLSGMQRDKAGNVDTTGIYYQIINQGKGEALDYDKRIAFAYTIKSLDGKYSVTDTFANHGYNFVGSLAPKGLMLAIVRLAKTKGTQARFLIPSRLAYGVAGSGTGSTRLLGNESLDYYVSIIDDVDKYDDISINKYITANNLTGYTKFTSASSPVGGSPSLYYRKILQAGTGTVQVTATSTLTIQYSLYLPNGVLVDQYNDQTTDNVGTSIALETDEVKGRREGFVGLTAGSKVSLILPSRLGYGTGTYTSTTTGLTVPSTSCLRYEVNILTVNN